jgi:hypothetical protein
VDGRNDDIHRDPLPALQPPAISVESAGTGNRWDMSGGADPLGATVPIDGQVVECRRGQPRTGTRDVDRHDLVTLAEDCHHLMSGHDRDVVFDAAPSENHSNPHGPECIRGL